MNKQEKSLMNHLKARLLAVVIILIFAGMIYYNWLQLTSERSYSMKLAAFGPVGVVGGLFLLLFPRKVGKPETAKDKIIVLLVFGAGLVAGLYNWYLMDPGFFGR
jgi:NhaP-type Na+/H+ or K+/H+ antiporter